MYIRKFLLKEMYIKIPKTLLQQCLKPKRVNDIFITSKMNIYTTVLKFMEGVSSLRFRSPAMVVSSGLYGFPVT